MKCLACGYENIYGSTVCKQCGTSLTAAAPEPVRVAPAAPVEASVQSASPAPASSNGNAPKEAAAYPNELTFIPYIGNEQFNHFLRVLRRAFDFNTRSSRAEFWWFMLFQILISVAIIIILPILSTLFSLIASGLRSKYTWNRKLFLGASSQLFATQSLDAWSQSLTVSPVVT